MGEDGTYDRVRSLEHDLRFGDDGELHGGDVAVSLASGATKTLAFESTGRGTYMDGAGYSRFHGIDHGGPVIEHERWPLDGTRSPLTLDFPITDAFCRFRYDGVRGTGVTEYALTRSPSYRYRPTR